MERLHANQARDLAINARKDSSPIDEILKEVERVARLGRREFATKFWYNNDILWSFGAANKTPQYNEAKIILENLGYTVTPVCDTEPEVRWFTFIFW